MKKLTTTLSFLLFLSLPSFAQLTPITGNFVGVAGVETDADGNLWVTETGDGTNNGQVTRVKPNMRLKQPKLRLKKSKKEKINVTVSVNTLFLTKTQCVNDNVNVNGGENGDMKMINRRCTKP